MSLETNKNGNVIKDYTSNFAIKEYVQNVMIPKAYPNIPMEKLNLGFTGIVSEYMSQAIEDAYATGSLMINESFITRAVLPNSIYSEASLYDKGYTFAKPSTCNFGLQIWLPDVMKYATKVQNSSKFRYVLDKDTRLILNDNSYRLDYDIIIEYQSIGGKYIFNVYYDMSEENSISDIASKYIKHQVTSIDWLVLFVDLKEFERKTITKSITDNLVTVNSDVELKWTRQIAGLDVTYITPTGLRRKIKLKNQYTKAEIEPFAWYRFETDNIIKLSFSSNSGYFSPEFNSKIESIIYMCNGSKSNFDQYNSKSGVAVQKTGKRYSYNAQTKMVALCYSGSNGGLDKGDIESLRNDVILLHNTSNTLISDHDLNLWFENYGKRYNSRSKFFKRRDDPSGTLFSQFIAITNDSYIYPTNTLNIIVEHDQFDFINNNAAGINEEFIIKPGHLWEYIDDSRSTVRMINSTEGLAMVTDETLPPTGTNRPYMFTNPFYIKIYRDPTISMNYNYLINDTSWPEDLYSNPNSFYQFQLATFSVERSLSSKNSNKYKLQVICVPTITTDKKFKYVEGIGDGYDINDNKLRLILVTRCNSEGETGYIEMTPIEIRKGGAILFETYIAVDDNISTDMTLSVDIDRTPTMKSLISHGINKGKIIIDSQETSFHFICLMKDIKGSMTTSLFDDPAYDGYLVANRFANANRDLILYKPLSMMKSVITFEGENNNYTINASLIPFLKYDIPLDEEKMTYFIRAFSEQYNAIEPVLSKMKGSGNATLDYKLYNTYGRSTNYFIGPKDGSDTIWDSDILLDNVYLKIRFVLSVYDRSLYTQTVSSIINDLKLYFESLDNGTLTDVHVSDLIHMIKENNSNVRYLRFLGFNDYDANKQSIFIKENDTSKMNRSQLSTYVPEMIRIDENSIEFIEEV